MPQSPLHDAIRNLYNMGILDVVLPFLLIFVILYAALVKTKILHPKDRKVNKAYDVTIALVIALLVVTPHVMFGTPMPDGRLGGALLGMPDVVEIMNNALPSIAVWVIAILMVMLLTGLFGFGDIQEKYGKWIVAAAVLVVIYIFGNAAGFFGVLPGPLRFLNDDDNQLFLLILFIFGIVIWFIAHGKGAAPGQPKGPEPQRPEAPGREDVSAPGSR